MDNIDNAIKSIAERNLDAMRENIYAALGQKAADKLEEKKQEVASLFFGQK